jgi:hypothetical protein
MIQDLILKQYDVNLDWDGGNYPEDFYAPEEFSLADHECLVEGINEMIDKEGRVFVEIGVSRSGDKSSTVSILKYKKDSDYFFGIDLDDKSYLTGSNVHTIRCSSSQIDHVMSIIEEKTGKREIDFLHIDGWHSINQCIVDWLYTNYMKSGGIILMHDTNYHPGPVALCEMIDQTKYKLDRRLVGSKCDFGVTKVTKL